MRNEKIDQIENEILALAKTDGIGGLCFSTKDWDLYSMTILKSRKSGYLSESGKNRIKNIMKNNKLKIVIVANDKIAFGG